MNDIEIAKYLCRNCYRRMSGREIALCAFILDGEELHKEDRRWFESLKTQFAAELANATPVPAIHPTEQAEVLL
jgi:hypothetical protein